jgi:L-lactate utilization protein LutB
MFDNKNQAVENCNLCGICNLNCPVYAVLLKESAGARFKAFLAKKKKSNKIFFLCTECDACVQDCPAQINLNCLEIRKDLVAAGVETPANKIMRENIKKFGNSLGETKKGKKIKQFYT